jgi:hypothetical protein
LALWILIGALALWVPIGPLAFWVTYVLAILAFRCISCERGVLGKYSTYRHCFPVRLSLGGCSFQFGRTSILFRLLPHLPHFMEQLLTSLPG